MTPQAAIDYILRQCGYRQEGRVTVLAELNFRKEIFDNNPRLPRPWWNLTTTSGLVLPANNQEISLPPDFLAEYEKGDLYYFDTDAQVAGDNPWFKLYKDDDETLRNFYKDSQGVPQAYSLVGSDIVIYPSADQTYQFRWRYYRSLPDYTDSTATNGWLQYCPWLLVGEAGYGYASALQNTNAMQFFEVMRKEGRDAYFTLVEEREHTNRAYVQGSREHPETEFVYDEDFH